MLTFMIHTHYTLEVTIKMSVFYSIASGEQICKYNTLSRFCKKQEYSNVDKWLFTVSQQQISENGKYCDRKYWKILCARTRDFESVTYYMTMFLRVLLIPLYCVNIPRLYEPEIT